MKIIISYRGMNRDKKHNVLHDAQTIRNVYFYVKEKKEKTVFFIFWNEHREFFLGRYLTRFLEIMTMMSSKYGIWGNARAPVLMWERGSVGIDYEKRFGSDVRLSRWGI